MLLSSSLNDKLLAQKYYEKWDGALPHFYGADDALIEIPAE